MFAADSMLAVPSTRAVKCERDVAGMLPSIGRILREAGPHQRVQRRCRERRVEWSLAAGRCSRIAAMSAGCDRPRTLVRRSAFRRARRRTRTGRCAHRPRRLDLLRRHVRNRAANQRFARRGQRAAPWRRRLTRRPRRRKRASPKSSSFTPDFVSMMLAGFKIAMDDAQRVRRAERVERSRSRTSSARARSARLAQPRRQRLAVEQLHHEEPGLGRRSRRRRRRRACRCADASLARCARASRSKRSRPRGIVGEIAATAP